MTPTPPRITASPLSPRASTVSEAKSPPKALCHGPVDRSASVRPGNAAWPAVVSRSPVPEALVGEWDRLRVDQIIRNLVTNALKFGHGRPVELRVEDDAILAKD